MQNARQLKTRIRSTQNTKKVTRAMQLISAVKLRKVQNKAVSASFYSNAIQEITKTIDFKQLDKSKLIQEPEKISNIGILVVGPMQGFTGNMISKMISNISKQIIKLKAQYPEANFSGISLHKHGLKILSKASVTSKYHFSEEFLEPNTTILYPVYQTILKDFLSGELDIIFIVYTHFTNLIKQEVAFQQLLPVALPETVESEQPASEAKQNFHFEPDMNEIIDFLVKEQFENQILSAILDSNASENASRMVTMQNATDNAASLVQELVTNYNKQRQTQITQSLMEISSIN